MLNLILSGYIDGKHLFSVYITVQINYAPAQLQFPPCDSPYSFTFLDLTGFTNFFILVSPFIVLIQLLNVLYIILGFLN